MEYTYESNRIYAKDKNDVILAEVTFPSKDEDQVNVDRVYVNEKLRGEGRASEIMLKTYQYLKEKHKKVIAKCPYAIHWFKKHPEYQDIVINLKTKE